MCWVWSVHLQVDHLPSVWWSVFFHWGQCRPSRRSASSLWACSPCKVTPCCSVKKCSACATGDQKGHVGHGSWTCSATCFWAHPGRKAPTLSYCHPPRQTPEEKAEGHQCHHIVAICRGGYWYVPLCDIKAQRVAPPDCLQIGQKSAKDTSGPFSLSSLPGRWWQRSIHLKVHLEKWI